MPMHPQRVTSATASSRSWRRRVGVGSSVAVRVVVPDPVLRAIVPFLVFGSCAPEPWEQRFGIAAIDRRVPLGVERAVRVELRGEVAHGDLGSERPVAAEEHMPRFCEREKAGKRRGAAGQRGVEVEAPEILEYGGGGTPCLRGE